MTLEEQVTLTMREVERASAQLIENAEIIQNLRKIIKLKQEIIELQGDEIRALKQDIVRLTKEAS